MTNVWLPRLNRGMTGFFMKFNIDPKTGRLQGVQNFQSPHRKPRPQNTAVDLLVIHNISLPPGKFGGEDIHHLFMGTLDVSAHPFYQTIPELAVSAHVLIRREGEVIQYVSFYDMAWHAGVSQFQGRSKCNEFSVGIELEGTDELPYEPVQYEQLIQLADCLSHFFPGMTVDRMVGHSDVAPGRKTDPGKLFDWILFRTRIKNVV